MSSRLLAGCQDQHGTHTAPQLASVYLFAGNTDMQYSCGPTRVRAHDAVAVTGALTFVFIDSRLLTISHQDSI